MIQKISFENYKAFKKGEIKIKPITILLGANSVGKSSIVNLLLMLQQTANSNTYKSALRLHGENVSMGECENIFRNKDTSQTIAIEFEFESDLLRENLKKDLFEEFIYRIFQPIEFLSRFPFEKVENEIQIDINQFLNSQREIDSKVYTSKEHFLKLLDVITDLDERIQSSSSDMIKYYLRRSRVILNEQKELELLYDFLKNARKVANGNSFCFFVELCYVESNKGEKVLKIERIKIRQNESVILNIIFEQSKNKSSYNSLYITTELLSSKESEELLDEKAKEEFSKLINYESTIFSWLSSINTHREFF